MPLVKDVSVRVTATGIDDAKLKIGQVTAAAKELDAQHPTIQVEIDKQKALLEARLLREGIKAELSKVTVDTSTSGKGSILGLLTGGLSGTNPLAGGSGILGAIGSGGAPAIAGVAAAAGALLVEVTGLVSGITAAGVGLGAFGLLALPTLDSVKKAYTGVQTAQQNVVSAQKTYTDAVEKNKLDPTKTNATAVAAALLKVKVAQQDLANASKGPGGVVTSIQSLINQFDQMGKAFQPTALLVINDALKIAHTLLPDLQPFAQAAGGAIDGLLKHVETFFKSADFGKWLDKFSSLVGPSLTALGTGVGGLAKNFGNLLTVLPPADVVRSIAAAFDVLNASLIILTGTVKVLMGPISALAAVVSFLTGSGGNLKPISGGNVANIPGNLGNLNNLNFAGLAPFAPPGTGPGGGKLGHLAAGGYGSGLTLVGENGPELLNLPAGSQVYNHQQTAGMLSGGGTQRMVLEITGGSREFQAFLKKTIRLTGGDPGVTGR